MVAELQTEQASSKNTLFLNPRVKCSRAQQFDEQLSARIIGQERAVESMSSLLLGAAARRQQSWVLPEQVGHSPILGG